MVEKPELKSLTKKKGLLMPMAKPALPSSEKLAESKPHPIGHYLKIMLLILSTALALDGIISFVAVSIVRQQSSGYLEDAADLYIDRINHDFEYMNHYMGWTLVNDESVKAMAAVDADSAAFREANTALYKRFSELRKNYGQPYNFFLYLKNQDFFANSGPMTLNYTDFLALRQQIDSYTDDRSVYRQYYSRWTPVQINGTYYVINIVPFYDRYLIGLISAEDLIRPLSEINLGANGQAILADADGHNLVDPIAEGAPSRSNVTKSFSNAALSVKMTIKFGTFEKIMIAQLLIMLLLLVVTFTLSTVMLIFNRRVLKPIQSFAKNLALLNDDDRPHDFKSSKIVELEQANAQFKYLAEQIRAFKIHIYEREMEKQRIQLDYMKLQINPHFFLNCLTTMHSMAQMQMYEGIEQMAISTSKYFRYIFQQGQDFVRLEDELDHAGTYLHIQQHRYRDAFSYEILPTDKDRIGNARIPPLAIMTFIENAVKYAVSRDEEAHIRIEVDSFAGASGKRLRVRVSDDGPGFPADILAKLSLGEPLDQSKGTHIGITNTLQRLELLYAKEARVGFSNEVTGGARVTLDLPYEEC